MDTLLRLPDRAVHVFLLRELAKENAPGKATAGCLGDMKTSQVVKEYIQPATGKTKTNYVDCLCQGLLGKYQPTWCPGGTLSSQPGTPRAIGPTTYFVSHAWSYAFSGLVGLVERHYAGLPDTDKGKKFIPVFYWVDILAVTQHFTGQFTDHPDSDFPGVIRASKAVLFTIYPWRSPIAPTRVWCLFEALTAVQSDGVELEVLLDTGGSKDTGVGTVMTVTSSIDVRAAQASVASDKAYIMGCIRDGVGIEAFNAILRKRLKGALVFISLKKATAERDSDAIVNLLKAGGGRGSDDVLDVPRWLPYGSADNVASLLDGIPAAAAPRKLVLAGREAGQNVDVSVTTSKATYRAPVYTYMPLRGKVLAAVARLLQRQEDPAGGAARVSASSSGRRAAAGGRSGAGGGSCEGNNAPSRASSKGPGGASAVAEDAGSLTGAIGGLALSARGSGLQELWLRPAPAVDSRVSYRPAWATPVYVSPEEKHLYGSVDPRWTPKRSREDLQKLLGPHFTLEDVRKYIDDHQDKWRKAELAKLQAAAEARAAAERPAVEAAERKDRAILWPAIGSSSSLTVLGLYNGWLGPEDVAALGRALRQHRTLRQLHLVAMRPEEGYPGGLACLTRELLCAALGSRGLELLVLAPPELVLIGTLEVPAAAAWDLGGGAALREFCVAPVALGPRVAKQLAELLAALPQLASGTVDVRKGKPPVPLPGEDYAPPGTFCLAVAEAKFLGEHEHFSHTCRLEPVLRAVEGLRGSAAAAGARAAALSHYLALLTGPTAVRTLAKAPHLQADVAQLEGEYRELLGSALQAAPRDYANRWRNLVPGQLRHEGEGAPGGAEAADSAWAEALA